MVNDSFRALAHPIRQGIVERLAAGPATVGEATSGFGVSKPAITKHLRVLEDAGVVTRTVDGRTHRLALDPTAMTEAAGWLMLQRSRWESAFDAVGDDLPSSGRPRTAPSSMRGRRQAPDTSRSLPVSTS
jgi:DNA-binding transcriptional ArsR family regulator